MSARRGLLAVLVLLTAACSSPLAAQAETPAPAQKLALAPLKVETAKGALKFQVEIADTEPARNRGLMFRTSLADDRGMLFIFDEVQPATFWMKNTVIPLDIIFIKADGRILNIAPMATPYSEKVVPSAGPVKTVLELRGGRAAELGIQPGDKVVFGKAAQ